MYILTHMLTVQGLYALFASAGEAYLCRDDTYAWFSRKMGSKEKGMRLRRGYEQPRPVRALIDTAGGCSGKLEPKLKWRSHMLGG